MSNNKKKRVSQILLFYEGWNFNSGNCEYLFTTDTK